MGRRDFFWLRTEKRLGWDCSLKISPMVAKSLCPNKQQNGFSVRPPHTYDKKILAAIACPSCTQFQCSPFCSVVHEISRVQRILDVISVTDTEKMEDAPLNEWRRAWNLGQLLLAHTSISYFDGLMYVNIEKLIFPFSHGSGRWNTEIRISVKPTLSYVVHCYCPKQVPSWQADEIRSSLYICMYIYLCYIYISHSLFFALDIKKCA